MPPLIGGVEDARTAVVEVASAVGRCSGTYVGDGRVVTAAHCVPKDEDADVLVIFDAPGVRGAVASRARSAVDGLDVAVIAFDDARIEVAGIPLLRQALTEADLGSEVTLVGFGADQAPAVRRSGASTLSEITEERASVRAGEGQARACFGDSGGPLLVARDGGEYLAGVLSTGAADCSGVDHYVRVDVGAGRALVEDSAGCQVAEPSGLVIALLLGGCFGRRRRRALAARP